MGNKLATGVGSSQSLRPIIGGSSIATRASTESLSTFVSVNSHADRCLLENDDSQMVNETSIDDTSTVITCLDDSADFCSNGDVSVNELLAQEKLKIPEKLLKKLTTEDWNDIVHFICSSMEQSLQSNILKTVGELREKNTQSLTSSSSNEIVNENTTATIATTDDVRKNEQTPNDEQLCDDRTGATKRRPRSKHHQVTRRPVSMPTAASYQLLSDNETNHCLPNKRGTSHHHHELRRSCHSKATVETLGTKTTKKHRSTSHKVHFVESQFSPIWRTSSRSSLDELDFNSKCKYFEAGEKKGYLTLDQLKDLGLSLQGCDSSRTTSERLSSFSMKCWHGDLKNNSVTTVARRRPKRRQKRKSVTKNTNELTSAQTSKPQFEQLCLLGPHPAPCPTSSPPPLGTADCTSPPAKEDVPLSDPNSSSEDSSPDVKVEHLHQHNHHHYHHFIHHSLSQPTNLCGSKPIHYIVSESQ